MGVNYLNEFRWVHHFLLPLLHSRRRRLLLLLSLSSFLWRRCERRRLMGSVQVGRRLWRKHPPCRETIGTTRSLGNRNRTVSRSCTERDIGKTNARQNEEEKEDKEKEKWRIRDEPSVLVKIGVSIDNTELPSFGRNSSSPCIYIDMRMCWHKRSRRLTDYQKERSASVRVVEEARFIETLSQCKQPP